MPTKKPRYSLLDALRGLLILDMLVYHTAWDLRYIFGVDVPFLGQTAGNVFQYVNATLFVSLSGFCWSMGRNPLRRGLECFGFGALLSIITITIMPENRVLFGVLTLIGTCMILLVPLERIFRRVPAVCGVAASAVLFAFTRNLSAHWLGFGEWRIFTVPDWLYTGNVSAYLGFPPTGFYSTDYFAVVPWFFAFCAGYFLYRWAKESLCEEGAFWRALCFDIKPLSFVGRNSLVIYLFHQPVIYGALWLWFTVLQ